MPPKNWVPLQVLVNNAANDQRHAPQDVTLETWRRCMAINLDATFFAAQAAAAVMALNDAVPLLTSVR